MTNDRFREPSRVGVPLLPPDWPALAPLLDALLDEAPEHRAALIIQLSAGDPDRERALTHLVAECERGTPLLDRAATERFDGLRDESPDSLLPEILAGRYQVGRELGRGGMARVYLARDMKHGRDVALKVIRPELAASLGHDRFLREIEIAARLNHPNIVPLHDSGEVGDSLYFVMPYEEGPSLRERLDQGGALPLSDALHVLRDVARALAYAHEHGVVHRDVKPDNVMLSGGAAVVTDFGIAKAVSAALTDVSGPTLTQAGSGIGTPAYMAPEQATGDPSSDHRADIYSFGCLAYELLSGKPPFDHESVHLVIAAHIATVPRSVTTLQPHVPPAVADLIARCLEKNPAARPQSARELLDSLEGAATGTTNVARRPARARRLVGLALVVGVIGTGVYLATRASGTSEPISLTVLPFGNIGADSAMDLVAGGLAEEVASALARVPGIQIKSRSGARAYRGTLGVDVTEAGARLKADYVMTGVIREDRGNWILSADVARAADASSLWGDAFNLSPDQQAGTSEAIVASLVAGLRSRFPRSIGSPVAPGPNQRTSNNEAFRLYLNGQEKIKRRQNVKEAAELFRAAIAKDSLYARAWSGLSMALAFFPTYQGVPAKDIRLEVVSAARRALELDSTLAQPHIALGAVFQFDYQWDSAATEFQTAMRLDRGDVDAIMQFARNLRNRGRVAEAIRVLRAAREEDPASASVLSQGSYLFYLDHQLDSAVYESGRALENDPNSMPSIGNGALVMLAVNRPDSARKLADRPLQVFSIKEYLIAKSGDTATARQGLEKLDAQKPQPWMAETRRGYAYLGLVDTARALSAMERALDAKEDWPGPFSPFDPMFNSVRRSTRYAAVLRRIGLTP